MASICMAQQQYNVGTETVYVPGPIVSTIKLVDYANKQIGSRYTHILFDSKKVVFSFVSTEGEYPHIIVMQVITKDAVKNLVSDVEVKKSTENSDEKTNPAAYWEVSVGFRKPDGDVVEAGSTTYYKNDDGTAIINKYLGTSYLVPFSTKKAADAFAAQIKSFIKE